jgi:TonB family protein
VVSKAYKIKGNRFLTNVKTLDGKPTGIWYKYDKFGNLIYRKDFREIVYSNAPIKDSLGFKKDDPRRKFYNKAQFPGGIPALMAFIKNHMKYSGMSKAMGHTGKVIIRFIVEKDGTAKPYSIMKSVDPFLDLEAWQMVKELPKWTPAKFKGKPVSSIFFLPVKFSIR